MAPRFTKHECSILEAQLKKTPYPTPKQVSVLADEFGRTHASIASWFRRNRRESIQMEKVKPATYSKAVNIKQLYELTKQLHMVKSKDQTKQMRSSKNYRKAKANAKANDAILEISPEKELQMILIDDDTWNDGYVPMRESDDVDVNFMVTANPLQEYWKQHSLLYALLNANCI